MCVSWWLGTYTCVRIATSSFTIYNVRKLLRNLVSLSIKQRSYSTRLVMFLWELSAMIHEKYLECLAHSKCSINVNQQYISMASLPANTERSIQALCLCFDSLLFSYYLWGNCSHSSECNALNKKDKTLIFCGKR